MPSSSWGFVGSGIVIPAGIIMPFNDVAANIPAGWLHWTDAAYRALRGGALAGVDGGISAVARTTATEGGHTGTPYTGWGDTLNGSYSDKLGATAGAHAHSLTINYTPARRLQTMMKALSNAMTFPPKTGLLSDTVLDLTDITPTGYLLCGGAGADNANSAASSSVSGVSTAGGHAHIAGVGTNNGANQIAAATRYNQGAHSHGGVASVIDSIKRFWMGMWTNASADIAAVPGVYGLWESGSPPKGWAICDGTNGTPDLTDYHIGMDSGSALGTKTGNGTITTAGSLASAGGHTHNGDSALRDSVTSAALHSNSITHSHAIPALASAFSPLYRTIIFIKAIG